MEDVTPSLLIHKVNRLLLEQADLRRQLKKIQAEIKPICERLKRAIDVDLAVVPGPAAYLEVAIVPFDPARGGRER